MMFQQSGTGIRNGTLFVLFFVMIATCSSSPVLERIRRGAGAGNCNGGRNTYQFFCYGAQTGGAGREADVQNCFNQLAGLGDHYGCYTRSQGNCECTVDSSYIFNWDQTFAEARQNLYQQCHGFTNNIIERYEGNMYLTATCN